MTDPQTGPMAGPDGIKTWASDVEPGRAAGVMDSLLERASAKDATVLVLDAAMVFGSDHLASALYHARKAIDEGRNASDSLQMETLLYSSGERQLGSAIRKMSVSDSTTLVAVSLLSGSDFHPGMGWKEVPRTPEDVDPDALKRYGITESEMSTVNPDRVVDLVLERVANVDLVKK
jgi:tRNA threonylcarbamoyladenosine modification (KEOPS) complex Cgi121 subunit